MPAITLPCGPTLLPELHFLLSFRDKAKPLQRQLEHGLGAQINLVRGINSDPERCRLQLYHCRFNARLHDLADKTCAKRAVHYANLA